jgi:hypothetical protein
MKNEILIAHMLLTFLTIRKLKEFEFTRLNLLHLFKFSKSPLCNHGKIGLREQGAQVER